MGVQQSRTGAVGGSATAGLRSASGKPGHAPKPSSFPPVPQSSLDLSYISPRLIACGRPSVRQSDLVDNRNNVAELGAFLEQKHGDTFLVCNLSNKNRTQIDYTRFRNSVVEFAPFTRPDLVDDTPAIGEVFRACYCLKFFLEWGPETVLVVHCNNGVFRSGFLLAAFLCYMKQASSMSEALAFFSTKRLEGHINEEVAASGATGLEDGDEAGGSAIVGGEAGGAESILAGLGVNVGGASGGGAGGGGGGGGGVGSTFGSGSALSIGSRMMPSWRFLARQIDHLMSGPAALPKAMKLAFIILNAPGLMRPGDDNDPVVQIFEGPKLVFDSSKDSPENGGVRWEEGKLLVELPATLADNIFLSPPRPAVPPMAGSQGKTEIFEDGKKKKHKHRHRHRHRKEGSSASSGTGITDGSEAIAAAAAAQQAQLQQEQQEQGLILCGDYQLWILTPARDRNGNNFNFSAGARAASAGFSYLNRSATHSTNGTADESDSGGGGGGANRIHHSSTSTSSVTSDAGHTAGSSSSSVHVSAGAAEAAAQLARRKQRKEKEKGRERKHAARFVFHTSLLEEGINSFDSDAVDIFR